MKHFPKPILDKINTINSMIDAVNDADDLPFTYNGGTYPILVQIKPIIIHNQFVTIINDKGSFIDGKERYNVNKKSICGDDYCKDHLNYTLNVILKTFKKLLNTK